MFDNCISCGMMETETAICSQYEQNGKPVNNLDDMEEALKHVDTSKKAELVIFRNQKEHKVVIPL